MESPNQNSERDDSTVVTGEIVSSLFSQKIIQLTQKEYIEFKRQINYWKSQHARQKKQNEELKQELDYTHAKVRDLQQRLYGKKNEKGPAKQDNIPATDNPLTSSRPRGQQKGSPGHGRTARPDLPLVEEERDIAPEDRQCRICGQTYDRLSQTENSKIIEIHVKAHIRMVKRRMYTQACQCDGVQRLITASPAPRLIPKGVVGISVWTEVLINKSLFARATYTLCIDYSYRGLPIAQGTLTSGLKRMVFLFRPLLAQLTKKQLTEQLFHNDETGWKVFEAIEGKVGY